MFIKNVERFIRMLDYGLTNVNAQVSSLQKGCLLRHAYDFLKLLARIAMFKLFLQHPYLLIYRSILFQGKSLFLKKFNSFLVFTLHKSRQRNINTSQTGSNQIKQNQQLKIKIIWQAS